LLDLALLAGQVSLLLNEPIRRSWADIARFTPETIDDVALQSVISVYENGLHFIAAPTMPAEAEKISPELYIRVLDMLREQYDYIVADLAHDFSEISLHTLDRAGVIIVPIAPELASARAATLTLDTYRQLGYPEEKSLVVLNTLSSTNGISREKLEAALGKRIPLTLPYEPDVFWQALNFGRPLVLHAPESRSAPLLEDFAFYVSAPDDKKQRPGKTTPAWERVFQRYLRRRQKR
jgi:pilus assembly protein CpaE